MIGYLSGTSSVVGDKVLILTGGVGYEVAVALPALERVHDKSELSLWIYTHVREDQLELFGFLTLEERTLFKIMLDVPGVGPKMSLQLLHYSPNQLIEAVQTADVEFFTQIPRVGKKLAQQIIIQLTPKLGVLTELNLTPVVGKEADVLEALQALGFERTAAREALRSIDVEHLMVQQSIKQAIKKLQSAKL